MVVGGLRQFGARFHGLWLRIIETKVFWDKEALVHVSSMRLKDHVAVIKRRRKRQWQKTDETEQWNNNININNNNNNNNNTIKHKKIHSKCVAQANK